MTSEVIERCIRVVKRKKCNMLKWFEIMKGMGMIRKEGNYREGGENKWKNY